MKKETKRDLKEVGALLLALVGGFVGAALLIVILVTAEWAGFAM